MPGLGFTKVLGTGGGAFYFPLNDDPEITVAQKELAKVLIAKETQVAFNLKKGSLPVRGDVEFRGANDCMKKGLDILAAGNVLAGQDVAFNRDTPGQLEDLMTTFWNDKSVSVEDVQASDVKIIADAE